MPVYEYECSAGHVTERVRDVRERASAVRCPECGKRARRIMSLPNIRTEDNSPMRRMAPLIAGADKWTRSEMNKHLAERGTVITSQADRDLAKRSASVAKTERSREIQALEHQYRRLTREQKQFVSNREYSMLTPNEQSLVPKNKIVPDAK